MLARTCSRNVPSLTGLAPNWIRASCPAQQPARVHLMRAVAPGRVRSDGCGLDKTRLCTTLPELSSAPAAHGPPLGGGAFNFPNLLNFKGKCGLAKFWPHSGKPHGHAAKVPLQAWHAQTYPQDVWIRADLLCQQRLAEFRPHLCPRPGGLPSTCRVSDHPSRSKRGLTETGCAHPSLNRHIPDDGSPTGLHCRNVSRPSH